MPAAAARAPSSWHPAALLPVALAAWVYHPITGVFFFADDLVHLTEIVNEGPVVFLLRPFGGQVFLARNLVILGTYELFGVDPVAFQWTLLLAHLLNVWLLFGVLHALTASPPLAVFGAALWGTSPLAEGSLGWYCIVGGVLVATALLVVLRGAARAAATGAPVSTRAALGWCGVLLLGSTCYGPGLGVALAGPAVLWLLLPSLWRTAPARLAVLALPVATLALYVGLRRLYGLFGALSFDDAVHLASPWSGFEKIPALFLNLLAVASGGTLLGFLAPEDRVTGTTWLAAAVVAGGTGLVLWRGSAAQRRAALAMVALTAGVCFVIAAGRANLYAQFGVAPDVAGATRRYHYASTVPIAVLLCLALQQLGRLPGLRAVPAWPAAAAALALLLWGYQRSDFRIDERTRAHDYFMVTRAEVEDAIAAAPPGATVYLENRASPGYILGGAIPNRLFPGRAAVFLLSHPTGTAGGREVRFVEQDPFVIAEYAGRDTLLSRLLVYPDDVPPGALP